MNAEISHLNPAAAKAVKRVKLHLPLAGAASPKLSAAKTRESMEKQHIINQITTADTAIVNEDFDTLMAIYTDDAMLVIEPGRIASGKADIRKAFERIAVYFRNGLQVTQKGMEVLQAGDTALVLANTVISAPNLPETTRQATYTFRRNADGIWLCCIDNSYGHQIITV